MLKNADLVNRVDALKREYKHLLQKEKLISPSS